MKEDVQSQINNLAIQLARVEEKMDSIENMLKTFIDTVEKNYVKQADFNKWIGDEFAPIKTQAQDNQKLKWAVTTAIIGAIGSIVLSFLNLKK